MNDVFLNSYIAGISQTIIGHPFDTLKTLKQVYNNKSVFNILQYIKNKNGINYLYRGYIPPLIGGCLQNSIIFSSEYYINNKINNENNNKNNIYPGVLAGSFTSIIISPFELIKCKLQVNNKLSLKEVVLDNKKNLFRGLGLTMLRDSIGYGIYFSSYRYLQEKYNNPLINGGISGILSWIYSYPVDVIKTKYQISNESIKSIIKQQNIKTLTAGLNIMIFRAFFVNAGIFYIFEKLS